VPYSLACPMPLKFACHCRLVPSVPVSSVLLGYQISPIPHSSIDRSDAFDSSAAEDQRDERRWNCMLDMSGDSSIAWLLDPRTNLVRRPHHRRPRRGHRKQCDHGYPPWVDETRRETMFVSLVSHQMDNLMEEERMVGGIRDEQQGIFSSEAYGVSHIRCHLRVTVGQFTWTREARLRKEPSFSNDTCFLLNAIEGRLRLGDDVQRMTD
jgi:hypothetical protein